MLRAYLRDDIWARVAFLQGKLQTNSWEYGINYSSEWEHLRLFAVMEVANNGSRFSQELLKDAASFLQVAKFGLDEELRGILFCLQTLGKWVETSTLASQRYWKYGMTTSKKNAS